jgi:two-component system KDP operon response regulator KdpE
MITSNISPEILIIEDDVEIRRFLRTTFDAQQYRLLEATTAAEGLRMAGTRRPDVIVLDLGLPDVDGVEVIHQVRKRNRSLPIIILSVRSDEHTKITALDAGADDFVNKPFAVGELLARVRAALRRSGIVPEQASVFRTGDVEVDLEARKLQVAGKEVHLTRIEFKLLEVLIRHVDRVVTYRQLLKEVWGPSHNDQIHYLRVYMLQLRRKLESHPARPRYLRTESGIGYRLTTEQPLHIEGSARKKSDR